MYFIADEILKLRLKVLGVYRLIMKSCSKKFRSCNTQVIKKLKRAKGVPVIVCGPTLNEVQFYGSKVVRNFDSFKQQADVIFANRNTEVLTDVPSIAYSLDRFGGYS